MMVDTNFLQTIKDHLRIDGNDQDTELERLYEVAEAYVLKYLGYTELPWDSNPTPAPVIHAILLVIGDLYENREAVLAGQSFNDNPTVARLLNFYRNDMGL